MKRGHGALMAALLLFVIGFALAAPVLSASAAAASAAPEKNMVYDKAKLLDQAEIAKLNELANKVAAKRETDVIILTSTNAENQDVRVKTENFYDSQAPGYDKPHGNAVILTMDMNNREVYLAGFGTALTTLDDHRLDLIRNKITPALTKGDYARAFERYINLSNKYMGYKPGVKPDNILFAWWFQLGAALVAAIVVVSIMVFRSGGRVTVNGATYEDDATSGVLERVDQYTHTTVTKTRIPKNNGGSGGGGGGRSSGGSRGSF